MTHQKRWELIINKKVKRYFKKGCNYDGVTRTSEAVIFKYKWALKKRILNNLLTFDNLFFKYSIKD